MNESGETPVMSTETDNAGAQFHFQWIGWSSIFFAIAQSICTGFVALSGVRLLLGVAAFAAATGAMKFADNKLHVDAIRIPMVVLALGGALINLLALCQVQRLRARSSAAWRQKSVSPGKRNSERLQFVLSILTLVLLAAESWFHFKFTGHL